MSLHIFSLGRKIRGEEPMSLHKGGGGGSTTTTTKMEPWKPAQGQLQDILKQAKALYDKNGGLDAEAIQREMPGLTPEMAQSLQSLASSGQLGTIADNMNKYTGSAGEDITGAEQMAKEFANKDFSVTGDQINDLSSQLYDSETVRSQKEQLQGDLQDQYLEGVQQLNQSATMSGAMGSTRAGVAQGVLGGKTLKAQATGEADIMNSARGQAQTLATGVLQANQSNKLNQYQQGMNTLGNLGTTLSGQYSQNATAAASLYNQQLQNQFQAANVGQQMQNAQQETAYQNQVAQKEAPQAALDSYLNSVGKIAGLGGNNSGSSSGGGAAGPNKTQAALGGAMSGAASGAMIGSVVPGVGTAVGAVAGGIIGGASGLFSDATLKKDIKLKGKTKSGDAVYDWKWNEKGKAKGMEGSATGVLAQREASSNPAAVGTKQGVLAVDYDKTSVKPKQKKKKAKK